MLGRQETVRWNARHQPAQPGAVTVDQLLHRAGAINDNAPSSLIVPIRRTPSASCPPITQRATKAFGFEIEQQQPLLPEVTVIESQQIAT